jgi:hypothetical protein
MKIPGLLNKSLFILLLLLLSVSKSYTQTDAFQQSGTSMVPPQENIFIIRPHWAVGFQTGLLSGVGIGVQYHSQSRISLQVVAGGYSIDATQAFSMGAEIQMDFDVTNFERLYGFVGGGYHSYKSNTRASDKESLSDPFRLGAGVGYDYAITEKIVFVGSLALTYYTKTHDFFPVPQLGLFYHFR